MENFQSLMRIFERSPARTWFNIWQLHRNGKLTLYSLKKLDYERTCRRVAAKKSNGNMVKRLRYAEAIKPDILCCKKGAERGLV